MQIPNNILYLFASAGTENPNVISDTGTDLLEVPGTHECEIVFKYQGKKFSHKYFYDYEMDETVWWDGVPSEEDAELGTTECPEVLDRKPEENPILRMREASGEVDSNDPVALFLYLLARDHLPIGNLEILIEEVLEVKTPHQYTNGWLAKWAQDASERLKGKS